MAAPVRVATRRLRVAAVVPTVPGQMVHRVLVGTAATVFCPRSPISAMRVVVAVVFTVCPPVPVALVDSVAVGTPVRLVRL